MGVGCWLKEMSSLSFDAGRWRRRVPPRFAGALFESARSTTYPQIRHTATYIPVLLKLSLTTDLYTLSFQLKPFHNKVTLTSIRISHGT